MLTKDEYDGLEVGDEIATQPLFPGLDPDVIKFYVSEVTDTDKTLLGTFAGITIAKVKCALKGDRLEWSNLQ